MLKTAGLVLHRLKYSDSASIVKCFTQQHGTIPIFMRHGKKKPSLLDHQFYDLSIDKKPGRDLYNLREFNFLQELNPAIKPQNMTMWLLLNELCMKTTLENVPLPELFRLLTQLRSLLSEPQEQESFLEVALTAISHHLGILHHSNLPAFQPSQIELLDLLSVPIQQSSSNPTYGSYSSLLEQLQSHFDIPKLFALELLA